MKNKYGIGFFAAVIIIMLVISCASSFSFYKAKKEVKEEIAEEQQENATVKEPSISTDSQALKEDCYYLMEVNGYVVVYLSDKKTVYEYTDIRYDRLPSAVQEEIRNGKYMEDTEALYGFLENYSS